MYCGRGVCLEVMRSVVNQMWPGLYISVHRPRSNQYARP